MKIMFMIVAALLGITLVILNIWLVPTIWVQIPISAIIGGITGHTMARILFWG